MQLILVVIGMLPLNIYLYINLTALGSEEVQLKFKFFIRISRISVIIDLQFFKIQIHGILCGLVRRNAVVDVHSDLPIFLAHVTKITKWRNYSRMMIRHRKWPSKSFKCVALLNVPITVLVFTTVSLA